MNQNKQVFQKTGVVWFGALFCCALWGSAFPAVKTGYRLFQIEANATMDQLLFAGIRFFLAGSLVILIGSIMSRRFLRLQPHSYGKMVKLGLVQTVLQYICFYIGLANTTGVKGSIITAMNVFFSILIASFFFKQDKLNLQKWLGCLLGFMGVVIINLSKGSLELSFQWKGEGLMLLAALSYGFAAILIKRYSANEDSVVLCGYQFLFGGAVLMIVGFCLGGRITTINLPAILTLVYLACISAVAYTLWSVLLTHNPVSKVSIFGFMNPVFGVVFSAIFLGETDQAFGIYGFFALVLVSAGIYITSLAEQKHPSIEKS